MPQNTQHDRDRRKSRAKKRKEKRKKWWLKRKKEPNISGSDSESYATAESDDSYASADDFDAFVSAESDDSFKSAGSGKAGEEEFEEARATAEQCVICYRDDLNDDIIRPCHCIGENMGHHFSCLIKRIVTNGDKPCHCGQKFTDPRIKRIEQISLGDTIVKYWQFYAVCLLAIGIFVKNVLEGEIVPPPIVFLLAYVFLHFVLFVPSIFGLEGEAIEFTCQKQDGTEFVYTYEFGPKEGNMEINDVVAAITGETIT